MIWSEVESHWAAFVPQVMTRWPELDEDEVIATDGDRAAFAGMLSERYDLSPSVADSEIADWLMGLQPADAVMDPTRDNAQIGRSAAHINEGEDPLADDGMFGDDDVPDRPISRNV